MSIVKGTGENYTARCDSCLDTLPTVGTFENAVKSKKLFNWKSIPVLDKWMDFCASCVIDKKHRQPKEEF